MVLSLLRGMHAQPRKGAIKLKRVTLNQVRQIKDESDGVFHVLRKELPSLVVVVLDVILDLIEASLAQRGFA